MPQPNYPIDLKHIVKTYLVDHGYDGLAYIDNECGCLLDDLMPCESPERGPRSDCKPGHRTPCDCNQNKDDCDMFPYNHDWHIAEGHRPAQKKKAPQTGGR